MKVIITVAEALEQGIWDKVCDLRGINVWAINERLLDEGSEITLTEKEAILLGLITEGK